MKLQPVIELCIFTDFHTTLQYPDRNINQPLYKNITFFQYKLTKSSKNDLTAIVLVPLGNTH